MSTKVIIKTKNTELKLGERVKILTSDHPDCPSSLVQRTGAMFAQSVHRPQQMWVVTPDQVQDGGPNEYNLRRLKEKLGRFINSDDESMRLKRGNIKSLLMIMEDYFDRIDNA